MTVATASSDAFTFSMFMPVWKSIASSAAGSDAAASNRCSAGFKLEASGAVEQIFPEPYHRIHTQTVMPVAHLTWSAVWAGIAAGAVDRARAFVRKATHGGGGTMPPAAQHLTRANASLRTLRSLIAAALQRFEAAASDPAALESIDFQTGMNLLKVNASELANAL